MYLLVFRLESTSSGILLLPSMTSFTWLCMSCGSAATSLGTELLEDVSSFACGPTPLHRFKQHFPLIAGF
jgi:hypothetical protein